MPTEPTADRAGQRLGAYEIIREIGRGGMGAVYLAARADDQFRKLVALKILRGGYNVQEILDRFRHERQILASLSHPHITALLDAGSTPAGEPYFVMDYVEGEPLDRYVETHSLSVHARLELFRLICSAVQYVHQNLIVHRDLKPGNILVTADGAPKLLDFGIAKLLKPDLLMTTPEATGAQALLMTPAYASPEQIRGEPITTATDIYALGVLLYELLTGRKPYRVKSDSATELWRAILDQEPDKPSQADDKHKRRLEGDLDNILLKALRKEPARRYASVEQFSEDIRRHLENLPVLAHRDSLGYRTAKFARRHKVPVIAAAVAILSLIGGIVAALAGARIARVERARAETRFQDVRQLATTFLFDIHDSIRNLAGSTPARALIARTGVEYLDRLARESSGDPSLEKEIVDGYLRIGDVLGNPYESNLGDIPQAIQSYNKALSIASSLVQRFPTDVASLRLLGRCHLQLASVLPSNGKINEGLNHAGDALRFLTQALTAAPGEPETRLNLAIALGQRGDILAGAQSINLGRKGEAVVEYEKGLATLPDLPSTHPLARRVARVRVGLIAKLADFQASSRNRDAALGRYTEALHIIEQLSLNDPSNQQDRDLQSTVLNRLAFAQQDFGDVPAALQSFERASRIDEASLAADPSNRRAREHTIVTQKNLGDLYFYRLNNMAAALKCFHRAAALLEEQAKSDPGNPQHLQRLSETLTYLSSALETTGQRAEARRYAQRGLAIAKDLADRPNATHDHKYNYAWLAVTVDPEDLRDPRGALPYALAAVQMRGGADALALHVLSQAYAGIGDYERAIQTEERALSLFPAAPPGSPKSTRQLLVERSLAEYHHKSKK